MTTSYDDIASDYQKCKLAPWRVYVERFMLFEMLGDLTGKSVLDMACGEGIYSRQVARAGASKVVGVDLSQGMIDLARVEESRKPLNIQYHVHDATTVELNETFDIVLASYLFNYARTREQLNAMTRSVARHLAPGGRLIAVNNNPAQTLSGFDKTRRNDVTKSTPAKSEPVEDGTVIVFNIFQDNSSFTIENYHLSLETHAESFAHAGLKQLQWINAQVAPDGKTQFGPGYWDDFLGDPPVIFMSAMKA